MESVENSKEAVDLELDLALVSSYWWFPTAIHFRKGHTSLALLLSKKGCTCGSKVVELLHKLAATSNDKL